MTSIGVEHLGARVAVTLHRGLGTITGELVGVGRLGHELQVVPFALIELDDGNHFETSLAQVALLPAEPELGAGSR